MIFFFTKSPNLIFLFLCVCVGGGGVTMNPKLFFLGGGGDPNLRKKNLWRVGGDGG